MSVILFALLAAAQPTHAPAPTPPPATAATRQLDGEAGALVMAGVVGSRIFQYDRAAWVATDALQDHRPRISLPSQGGFLVEPQEDGALRAVFYSGTGPDSAAYFTADVRDGKVIAKQRLNPTVPLTERQQAMVRATLSAAQHVVDKNYRPCTNRPFNTVVFPGADGERLEVYLLTAQVSNDIFPMGGNYRVSVDAGGKVIDSRPFSKTCMDWPTGAGRNARVPAMYMLNHVLDSMPHELHVFSSYRLGKPIIITTPGRRSWIVRGARIEPAA